MFVETGPHGILLAGLRDPALAELQGRTLAGVATDRGVPPEDALMDLIVEDRSNVFAMYFSMREDNLRKQIVRPWVSCCSDAESQALEGVFLQANPHPRAYGAFARVLGRYVRDESLIALPEAVRRLTSLPATNLGLSDRGLLGRGTVADVVVFDPDRVEDHATPDDPHRYSTGMRDVLVNGPRSCGTASIRVPPPEGSSADRVGDRPERSTHASSTGAAAQLPGAHRHARRRALHASWSARRWSGSSRSTSRSSRIRLTR